MENTHVWDITALCTVIMAYLQHRIAKPGLGKKAKHGDSAKKQKYNIL